MRRLYVLLTVVALSIFFVTGCKKDDSPKSVVGTWQAVDFDMSMEGMDVKPMLAMAGVKTSDVIGSFPRMTFTSTHVTTQAEGGEESFEYYIKDGYICDNETDVKVFKYWFVSSRLALELTQEALNDPMVSEGLGDLGGVIDLETLKLVLYCDKK